MNVNMVPILSMPVPQVKNEEIFIKNAKRNKWLGKIPQVLFPNGEKVAVEWILKELVDISYSKPPYLCFNLLYT